MVKIPRCRVCKTPATEEHLTKTPCCLKSVGKICFGQGLKETGKCCLCQEPEVKSDDPFADRWEDYKFHFLGWSSDEDVADNDPPRLVKVPVAPVVSAGEKKETKPLNLSLPSVTITSVDDRRKSYTVEELKELSGDFRLHTRLPEELVPFLSQDPASQQNRKSIENTQCARSGPSLHSTPAVKTPSLKKRFWGNWRERKS